MCGKKLNVFRSLESQYGDAVFGAIKAVNNPIWAKNFLDSYLQEVEQINSSRFAAMNNIKDVMLCELGRQNVAATCRKIWISALENFFKEYKVRMDFPIRREKPKKRANKARRSCSRAR